MSFTLVSRSATKYHKNISTACMSPSHNPTPTSHVWKKHLQFKGRCHVNIHLKRREAPQSSECVVKLGEETCMICFM